MGMGLLHSQTVGKGAAVRAMSGKGFEPHKYLKVKALQRVVEQFDINKIRNINIEPRKSGYRAANVDIRFYEIEAKRDIFPDIEFVVWEVVEDDKSPTKAGKEGHALVVIIECEVNPNSNLLSDGVRKTAYKLLKETHKEWFKLILAKYKGVEVSEPEMFDEIWEFEKGAKAVSG